MDFWKIKPFSSSVQKKKQNSWSKNEATIIFSGFWNPNVPLILNRVLMMLIQWLQSMNEHQQMWELVRKLFLKNGVTLSISSGDILQGKTNISKVPRFSHLPMLIFCLELSARNVFFEKVIPQKRVFLSLFYNISGTVHLGRN